MARDEKGRFKKGTIFKDHVGERSGYLEAIKLDRIEGKMAYWLCKCHKCGNEKILSSSAFKTNQTCGCRNPYSSRERLYVLWLGIRQRCSNPNHISYKYYGEKGIKVCPEWENDFMCFKHWALETGYDETLPRGVQTIERKDTNGDYCPENCEWKTIQEQQKNKSGIKLYEYKGEKHNLTEWSDILNIEYPLLHARVCGLHWSIKEAIEIPFNQRRDMDSIMNVEIEGEKKSLLQISKETGISYGALSEKYKRGISIEDTIREYQKNNGGFTKRYEYNGKCLTISEWSKELGISEGTLRSRLSSGRAYDKVFTKEKFFHANKRVSKAEK